MIKKRTCIEDEESHQGQSEQHQGQSEQEGELKLLKKSQISWVWDLLWACFLVLSIYHFFGLNALLTSSTADAKISILNYFQC